MTTALVETPLASEPQRLRTLAELEVLDTPVDPLLQGLVRSASQLLGYPVAMVNLVDERRVWVQARHGVDATEVPREHAFCSEAIRGEGLFEVADAAADTRYADNPLVVGAPHFRAYAGMPLQVAGQAIGTLCLLDHEPRRLDARQAALLADLTLTVEHWFEARREHLELRAARADAASRLALLENLAEQAPGMLFQYHVDARSVTHFTYVSPQVRELFALEAEAVRHDMRPFLQRTHPEDRAGLRATLSLANLRTTAWQHQFRVELPGRAVQWRSARAAPVHQPDGSLLWHGFAADISEQAEVDQLRRDKHAAELASREKTAFLSRVSHELRTPLNAMLGFTQLLQVDADEPLTARQRERVDHAYRAGQRLLNLIDEVLDVGRIEQGARELTLQPLALRAMVADCLPMVTQMAEQCQVRLAFPAVGEGPDILVDGDRRALEQSVLNLLSNGIKYNRRGGTLTVALRRNASAVWIDVRDEGPGLDPAQQARLFRPFDRLGAEHTQVEGSGLGLVITRHLVEAMGGSIAVKSTPGQGSTFTLRLRRSAGDRPDAAAQARASDSGGTPGVAPVPDRSGTEGVTLLYIEDDPVNALLVQEALRARPTWHVVHAADGNSGLALAQALQPTVVLTDINLPGLTGHAIVQALRSDPTIHHTVCIALSADAMGEQVVQAMDAGFDDYWTKPLDVRALPERIEAWIERAQARNDLSTGTSETP